MKGIALAILVTLGGCAFSVKHPPLAVAAVVGTIGFATCEIGTDFEEHGTCAVVGLGAGALLGLVTWAAIAIGGPGDTVLQSSESTGDERPVPQDPTLDQPQPDPQPVPTPAAPAPAAPAPAAPAPATPTPAAPPPSL